eukprot:2390783-Alexandrium_andersonii.AAC.1
MSASLVGSEMCIRDSHHPSRAHRPTAGRMCGGCHAAGMPGFRRTRPPAPGSLRTQSWHWTPRISPCGRPRAAWA